LLHVPLRYVGVVGKVFVVLESDRGLTLMDQRAAHERVLFERVIAQFDAESAPSQKLLLPETFELAARDAQFLKGNLDALAKTGLGVSEFGDRTFLLDALPPFVKAPDARAFVLDLIDELRNDEGQGGAKQKLADRSVARAICRQAVRCVDVLTEGEQRALVKDLRKCEMPYTSPSGRPTLIEMNFRELERKFGKLS
jgi:DNA mismatch repair protein MutL